MLKLISRSFALCATIVLLFQPTPAQAAPWLPLVPGMRWEYQGLAGAHQVETITGFITLRGRVVATKLYAEGADAGLQNYWLLDVDGSVLLAGFLNPGAGLALVYEPPIRILPVPPAVGPQPSVMITAYDLFTDAVYATFPIRFDVTEDVMLSLPAGSFHAFGVVQAITLPLPSLLAKPALTLDGRTLGPQSPSIYSITTTDWFAEGVGVVQYQSNDFYQLLGFGLPTPTAQSSWGAIKRLFR